MKQRRTNTIALVMYELVSSKLESFGTRHFYVSYLGPSQSLLRKKAVREAEDESSVTCDVMDKRGHFV